MEKASCQIFEFARNTEPFSDIILDLMCISASYILHVVAKFDEVTPEESPRQLEERGKVFSQLKVSLGEWIARRDVIGGSSFGGNIPKYGSRTLRGNRGKRELQVCALIFHSFFYTILCFTIVISFSCGILYFLLMVQDKQTMTGKTLSNR